MHFQPSWILVLLVTAINDSLGHTYYNTAYYNRHCDPCFYVSCPTRGHKCFLIADTTCTTTPCPIVATCLLDPTYDPCTIGEPMASAAGVPLTCTATADCPQDATCEIFNVGGVGVSKCCFNPINCALKAGQCPHTRDTATCTNTCLDDGDCPLTMKCCRTACNGKKCIDPYFGWWWSG